MPSPTESLAQKAAASTGAPELYVDAGEHIESAAVHLAALAKNRGAAFMLFNGTRVDAKAGQSPGEIVSDWNAKQVAASEAWHNSSEGKAEEQRRKDSIVADQELHDELIRYLPRLDFANDVAVLDWLCDMQGPSDHVGVNIARETILEAFAAHGLLPSMNCGKDFRHGDCENEYRWLVGQALDGIRSVAIHGVFLDFAANWKRRFIGATS